jgi:hypothetical protein
VTERTRKQLAILGVLVAVLVAVMFVVSRGEGPTGQSGAPSNQSGQAGAQAGAPEVADVNLEALKAEHAAPSDPQRNLFAFRQRAAPPPVRSVDRTQVIEPQVPQGPPPLPPIQLKFIGVFESSGAGGKVAILSDGRGRTIHAREGETVDGQYKLIRIGTESVEMSYVDGRGRQTLRLSGQ